MIFHRHNFKQSEKDLDILFCSCGKVKDLHRCVWEYIGSIHKTSISDNIIVGSILKCKICGEHKSYYT
jgi:hypothetical protein